MLKDQHPGTLSLATLGPRCGWVLHGWESDRHLTGGSTSDNGQPKLPGLPLSNARKVLAEPGGPREDMVPGSPTAPAGEAHADGSACRSFYGSLKQRAG